jgi:hypothetical protein
MEYEGFYDKEISYLKKLLTPISIQEFIDSFRYNKGRRISIVDVYRQKKADCLEGACFAAYVLSINGFKDVFLIDLTSKNQEDDDHVICVFRENGLYGAIAQSKYLGLKYRNPVYKTPRELAMSYFEHYFNYSGVFDLRKHSVLFKLENISKEELNSYRYISKIEYKLNQIKHIDIVSKKIKLPKVEKEKFWREILFIPKDAKIGKKYIQVARKIKKV